MKLLDKNGTSTPETFSSADSIELRLQDGMVEVMKHSAQNKEIAVQRSISIGNEKVVSYY